jgi:hypothetical protein
MVELNLQTFDRTLAEVDKALEAKGTTKYKLVPIEEEEEDRKYLGMSQIGEECYRKLFYSFRKAEKRDIQASGIKAIEDGFLQEDVMANRLRMLPNIELFTMDPQNPEEQIGFSLLLGHFNGHCDGMIKGIIEAPQTWHTWEHKSVNQTKFNKLIKLRNEKGEKQALQLWDIIYFAQAQSYMHVSTTQRHFSTVTSPGGREYISIRTDYNRKIAEDIIVKAKAIIFNKYDLPSRISDKREYFKCKWCEFQEICHDGKFPDVNCKTCQYIEPVKNGENQCFYKEDIVKDFKPCKNHVYNPGLIQAELVEQQTDCCIYKTNNITFSNCTTGGFPEIKGEMGGGIYTSQELREEIKYLRNIKTKKQPEKEIEKTAIKAWDK